MLPPASSAAESERGGTAFGCCSARVHILKRKCAMWCSCPTAIHTCLLNQGCLLAYSLQQFKLQIRLTDMEKLINDYDCYQIWQLLYLLTNRRPLLNKGLPQGASTVSAMGSPNHPLPATFFKASVYHSAHVTLCVIVLVILYAVLAP